MGIYRPIQSQTTPIERIRASLTRQQTLALICGKQDIWTQATAAIRELDGVAREIKHRDGVINAFTEEFERVEGLRKMANGVLEAARWVVAEHNDHLEELRKAGLKDFVPEAIVKAILELESALTAVTPPAQVTTKQEAIQ